MNIAVLGGSNGGYATAADLTLAGHRVRLWRRSAAELAAVRDAGAITLEAEERQGVARIALVTTDVAEALAGVEVVVIPLPATTHEDLAKRLAPHLTEQQIVLLTPGTLGAYVLAREIARADGALPHAIAETGTLPYLTRKTGPATVRAPVRAANLPTGVFPASRTGPVLQRLAEVFPSIRPSRDAFDAALTNAGPIIHPPLVLLNAGAIDSGRFDIHAAGTTPSVRRVIDAVDRERVAAREALGYPGPHYEQATIYDETRAAEGLYGAGAKAKLVASGLWDETLGLDHRYVTEDVELGLAFLDSAARTGGVDAPTTGGLLQIFGALLGRQLGGRGRALEALGLGDYTLREIRTFFHEGWESPLWNRVLQ
jgi:opine dehydrogenase